MQHIKSHIIKNILRTTWANNIEILFSTLFTGILVLGSMLSTYDAIDTLDISKRQLLAYVCGSIVIWCTVFFGLKVIKQKLLQSTGQPRIVLLEGVSDKKIWFWATLAVFICYTPFILTSHSVLTPDSWNSLGQIFGDVPLNNAHPIIFTVFVSIFIHIGQLFGSLRLGAILFSVAQSAILAMIFAQIIVWLRREKIGRNGIIAAFLFYAILPVNAIAGIIMWKDILFAGFALLLLLFIRQLYLEKSTFFTTKKVLSFALLGFLFCVWRSNGFYAYMLFAFLATIISRKTFLSKNYLLLLFSPIVLFFIYSSTLSLVSNPTSRVVILSVPLQQIARTVKYHGNTLSGQDRAAINEVLPFDQLDKKYNPSLSDPVMWTLNDRTFQENKTKYAKLWLHLLMGNKRTFVAAFLYNSYGYAYPYSSSPTTTDILLDNTMHYNTFAGYTDTAYNGGGKLMAAEYRDLITSTVPFVGNIGLYTCILLICAYVAAITRRKELTGVFLILFCLFVTTVLGPVNGEFRYLYLFVVATPFIMGAVSSGSNEGSKKNRV